MKILLFGFCRYNAFRVKPVLGTDVPLRLEIEGNNPHDPFAVLVKISTPNNISEASRNLAMLWEHLQ